MPNVIQAVDSTERTLSEEYVQECFHSYLKSSLTHAKVEGLLDEDALSSAEADLMIAGPALCLYFAALRSTTNPPSVPLPRKSKNTSTSPPADLSLTNCPPAFRQFLLVWSQLVPSIQSLTPEHQHDLARIICGLEAHSSPLNPRLNGIAADLRAVAIEISMRRTFQEQYAGDLQVAIDSGAPRTPGGRHVKASFVPPPSYDEPPRPSVSAPTLSAPAPPSPAGGDSPTPSAPARSPSSATDAFQPTILAEDVPGIEFIRETLYAALADVLARKPVIRRLLRTDPPRAYFSAVAFAILDVAASSATRPDPQRQALDELLPSPGARDAEPCLRGVLGQELRLSDCPPPLRPFMAGLCAVGTAVHQMEEEDSAATIEALQRGEEDPPVPRLERVYEILERGVGHAHREDEADGELRRRRTSTEGRAVAFANRINGLALGMTKLRAFKERQELVFKVLAGVGS